MATRSRTSFKKRQKELLRMEKQKEKAAKRIQRKSDKEMGIVNDGTDEFGMPLEDDAMLPEDGSVPPGGSSPAPE